MNNADLTKYPEDEEFVNRILESRKRSNKEKAKSAARGKNNPLPEDAGLEMDGGVMLKTSEILDFAEGTDSD